MLRNQKFHQLVKILLAGWIVLVGVNLLNGLASYVGFAKLG